MGGVSTLSAQLLRQLAALLEGAIGVALHDVSHAGGESSSISTHAIVFGLLVLMLLSDVTTDRSKLLGELRALGEGAVWVAVGVRLMDVSS